MILHRTEAGYPLAFLDLDDATAEPSALALADGQGELAPELQQLARAAERAGLAILAGHDADEAALMLIHPDHPGCLTPEGEEGRAYAAALGIPELHALARHVGLAPVRRPGRFSVLLVASDAATLAYLAPQGRDDFERRAS